MLKEKEERSKLSIKVLKIGMIGLTVIILGRLFQLQILDYGQYRPLSRKNALRQKVVNPARGLIYSRHGKLLVDNKPTYSITITPANYDTTKTPLLAKLLNIPVKKLKKRIKKAREYSLYRSSKIYTDLNFKAFSKIEGNIWRLPGVGHEVDSKRHYPVDSLKASHIFGYLRQVSEKEYRNSDKYNLGDKTGKSGLEQQYNNYLWGQKGTKYILVNAMGQSLGSYKDGAIDKPPTKGANLYTSIDTNLQRLAEDLMKGKKGAVVALNPQNGAVLCMVSAPEYDIRKLSGRINQQYWDSLNTDPNRPLFNRAVSSREPPGSTIKPLMALIALKLGVITPQTIIHNPGYFYLGRRYNDHA
ncbi:MAG TPA: penicillin-binding transpeptidase domain-containing protein, partial [Balneolaceae bacterium]|nr:penicillin-binding transpeptidase domain-containing protein [Balneolaceae bacterium]